MTLAIQTYLRSGKSFDDLAREYSISAKRHKEYPNLVSFKYSQIESPMGEPIVQECRGIILDEADDWRVVAWPMPKFFNHGEGHAAKIDWSTARVQEKLDGSLCILYFYDGRWHVATSGIPDAGGDVNGLNMTFAKLFWHTAMNQYGPTFPFGGLDVNTDWTFMFELTTPYNRVVVPYKTSEITLIGMRNRVTGEEMPVTAQKAFKCVREFPLQTLDQILATFKELDGLHHEGYVVVDSMFNRIKVKHPAYVAIHHLGDGFGPRRVLEVVRSGENSEFLAYYPEYKDLFDSVTERFNKLVSDTEAAYERIKHIESQKEFAIEATKAQASAPLFQLRAGKIGSAREYFASMNIRNLMEMLKIKDIPIIEEAA